MGLAFRPSFFKETKKARAENKDRGASSLFLHYSAFPTEHFTRFNVTKMSIVKDTQTSTSLFLCASNPIKFSVGFCRGETRHG